MSATLIATVGGLITALCWGVADWIIGRSSKKSPVLEINFAVQFVGAVLAIAILLYSRVPIPSQSQLLTIFISSALIALGYLLFVKALSSGSVGIVVPLSSTYPLITLLLSIIFLGSVFTHAHILAMFGIVLGAVMLAYEKNHEKIPAKKFHRETFLSLSATLVWGLAFFVLNPIVGKLAWQAVSGFTAIFMTAIAILLVVVTQRTKSVSAVVRSLKNRDAVIAALVYEIASIALYGSAGRAKSIIIPLVLGCSAPLVASILAAIYDKEKIGTFKRIGAIVTVAGIIVLNIT